MEQLNRHHSAAELAEGDEEMFGKRKRPQIQWRQEGKIPVIRASICTGEKVAGFRDEGSGKFQDITLIRTERDLKEFMERYGIREEEIRREW